jgi:hypothetical protein
MARILVGLFLPLLMVGSALAQKVTTDFDRSADFSGYTTYAWVPSQNPAKSPLWHARIIENVDQQLAAKGLRKMDAAAEADLYVTYNGGLRETTSLQGFGTGGRWSGGSFSVNKVTETEGTLIVDLFDPRTRQLVWRGIATETVSEKTEKNIAKLEKVVKKLFKDFPPKSEK